MLWTIGASFPGFRPVAQAWQLWIVSRTTRGSRLIVRGPNGRSYVKRQLNILRPLAFGSEGSQLHTSEPRLTHLHTNVFGLDVN
jgi:hypothetical protein